MKLSPGQIADLIAKKATRFYQEKLGVGPRQTRVYIVEDMIIIRTKGRLLFIEQALIKNQQFDLVKNIRQVFHEITTKELGQIITEITQHKIISSHSDISTKTGEGIEIFVLDTNYETELKESQKYPSARETVEKV